MLIVFLALQQCSVFSVFNIFETCGVGTRDKIRSARHWFSCAGCQQRMKSGKLTLRWFSWRSQDNSSFDFSRHSPFLSFFLRCYFPIVFTISSTSIPKAGGRPWFDGCPHWWQGVSQSARLLRPAQPGHRVHWPCHLPCRQPRSKCQPGAEGF